MGATRDRRPTTMASWTKYTDTSTGQPYWHHSESGLTQWENPDATTGSNTSTEPCTAPVFTPPPPITKQDDDTTLQALPTGIQTTVGSAPVDPATATTGAPPFFQVASGSPGFLSPGLHYDLPFPQEALGSFQDGLCDFSSDWYSCCLALWCPCVSVYQLLDKAKPHLGDPWTSEAVWCGALLLPACVGLPSMHCFVEMMIRQKMRALYDIGGNDSSDTFRDFVVSWCCAPCSLSQMTRHIDAFPVPLLPAIPVPPLPPGQQSAAESESAPIQAASQEVADPKRDSPTATGTSVGQK